MKILQLLTKPMQHIPSINVYFFNANIKSCTDQISRKLASHRNRKKKQFRQKTEIIQKNPENKEKHRFSWNIEFCKNNKKMPKKFNCLSFVKILYTSAFVISPMTKRQFHSAT